MLRPLSPCALLRRLPSLNSRAGLPVLRRPDLALRGLCSNALNSRAGLPVLRHVCASRHDQSSALSTAAQGFQCCDRAAWAHHVTHHASQQPRRASSAATGTRTRADHRSGHSQQPRRASSAATTNRLELANFRRAPHNSRAGLPVLRRRSGSAARGPQRPSTAAWGFQCHDQSIRHGEITAGQSTAACAEETNNSRAGLPILRLTTLIGQ